MERYGAAAALCLPSAAVPAALPGPHAVSAHTGAAPRWSRPGAAAAGAGAVAGSEMVCID